MQEYLPQICSCVEQSNTKAKSGHFSRTGGWKTAAELLEWKVNPRLECSPDVRYNF